MCPRKTSVAVIAVTVAIAVAVAVVEVGAVDGVLVGQGLEVVGAGGGHGGGL